jgi:hypothetical protein
MNRMLHQSRRVHRADEQRQEHAPVIERRAMEVVGNPSGEGEGHRNLNDRFHVASIAQGAP